MQRYQKIVAIIRWLTRVAWLQVMLAFVYIPILIAWGLPVSLASIVGNMVFPLFLIPFLGLCATVFVTHIFGFTCTHAAWTLDKVTTWWVWLLRLSSPRWLVGFIDPGIAVLALIVLAGVLCAWLTHHWHRAAQLAIASALLIAILTLLKIVPHGPQRLELLYRAKTHVVTRTGQKLTLALQPIRAPVSSINNWIIYTLTPTLYKKYGTATIDELVLINPGPSLEKALAQQISLRICHTARVKNTSVHD